MILLMGSLDDGFGEDERALQRFEGEKNAEDAERAQPVSKRRERKSCKKEKKPL